MSLSTHQRIRRALAEKKKAAEEAAKLAAEQEQQQKPDFENMKIKELQEYAAENGIDLGSAKKKDEIIACIIATLEERKDDNLNLVEDPNQDPENVRTEDIEDNKEKSDKKDGSADDKEIKDPGSDGVNVNIATEKSDGEDNDDPAGD